MVNCNGWLQVQQTSLYLNYIMQLHDKGKVILTCLFAYFEAGLLGNIAE